MALASSNTDWGEFFLYKYTSISRSSFLFKRGGAMLMPPTPMNSEAVIHEIKMEIHPLKFTPVNDLARQAFTKHLPFSIGTAFVLAMSTPLANMPLFFRDKDADKLQRLKDKMLKELSS